MGTKKLTETSLPKVSLVIFTCAGREHLLIKTYLSFINSCSFKFKKIILAIDGKIDASVITQINPDVIIQHSQRSGYVNSIVKTIKLIDTPYFFWLEDDWEFPYSFSFENILPLFEDINVLQVILAKQDLDNGFNKNYNTDTYISGYGFSANPSLCRTDAIKQAFSEIEYYKKTESSKFLSFEPFVTGYSSTNNFISLVKYHNGKAFINHSGELESTAREYHMINSISEDVSPINKEYISGLQRERKITLYNKISAFFKLYVGVIYLSIKLFFSREAYDFAFRIHMAFLKRFKN